MARSIFRRQNIGNCALMQVQTQTRAQRVFFEVLLQITYFSEEGADGGTSRR